MFTSFAPPSSEVYTDLPAALAAAQGITVLRYASSGYITRADDAPAHALFPPRILADIEVGQSAADRIGLGGSVALTTGGVDLWDADNALGDLARYGLATGRPVALRTVPVLDANASDFGTPYSGSALAFAGLVREVERSESRRTRIAIGDAADALDVPLQPMRYAGGGSLSGGPELTDTPKPIALDACFNARPVALGNLDIGDGPLPTFQVHWRGVDAITAVRIRGVAQTIVAGAPGAAEARAWNALGLFQLGSSPDGEVTCDVRGDNDGGYVSTTAGILRRLLTTLGPQLRDADLDDLAWGLAEADLPGTVGWCSARPDGGAITAAEDILRGCGAILAGQRNGALRLFDPIALPTTMQFDLPATWIVSCAPQPMPVELSPAPVATEIAWGRNWSPLASPAAGIPAAERERLSRGFSGPERATGQVTLARQARQRVLGLPGLYGTQADAAARAARWQAWIDAAPQLIEVTTDRYLGVINCGDIGRVAWPAFGLDAGVMCCVVGWREVLSARRLTLTLLTLPE